MCFNVIRENKIVAKISEFTVSSTNTFKLVYANSEGSSENAQIHRLIRVFAGRLFDK